MTAEVDERNAAAAEASAALHSTQEALASSQAALAATRKLAAEHERRLDEQTTAAREAHERIDSLLNERLQLQAPPRHHRTQPQPHRTAPHRPQGISRHLPA